MRWQREAALPLTAGVGPSLSSGSFGRGGKKIVGEDGWARVRARARGRLCERGSSNVQCARENPPSVGDGAWPSEMKGPVLPDTTAQRASEAVKVDVRNYVA